jgi:nitrogen fixation/metabolism regulation signal transduction histidine kinase
MRFQTKLLIIFALFLIIGVGLMVVISIRSERKIIDQVEIDLRNIVHTVHVSNQKLTALKDPDREALEKFIKEVKGNKAVKEVSIVSSTQQIVASSNPKKVGQHRSLDGKEVVVQEQFGIIDSTGRHNRYDVRIPIKRDNKIIGLVQTSVVVNDYRYLLQELQEKNMIIAGVALIFAFCASFFALWRLNKPLRQLSIAAEQVASGDLTIQLTSENSNDADEVTRLTKSFNTMTRKLLAQKELEDKLRVLERRGILAEMASNLAHEIRNPLNLINLTADHLGHEYKPVEDDKQKIYNELIGALKAEVQHLNKMVVDFMNIGRPSKLKKTRFTVHELFEQVQVLVKQHLMAKAVRLDISDDQGEKLFADLEQMRLVILNLLLNAVEAVPNNGRIFISVKKGEPLQGLVIIVRDNGPGIPPDDLERIFEPYFTKRPGGTGLGLALARRIVEEHDGKIKATNHPDGGAQFEISFPAEIFIEV